MVQNMEAIRDDNSPDNPRKFKASDIDGDTTLSVEQFYDIGLSVVGTKNSAYGAGADSFRRDIEGEVADIALVATGNGSAGLNAGDEIEGQWEWRVYNDTELTRLAYRGPQYSSEVLADGADGTITDRSNKVSIPRHRPRAGDDSTLAFEFKPDSGFVGAEIDADASGTQTDDGVPYHQKEL